MISKSELDGKVTIEVKSDKITIMTKYKQEIIVGPSLKLVPIEVRSINGQSNGDWIELQLVIPVIESKLSFLVNCI